MLLSLSNSLPFAWISLVKLGKNSKNSYFSDFEPIFLLFGGVCSKRDFSKKKFFLREGFFETNLDLNKHPQQVFWFFWAFFSNFFSKKNNHYILEELRQLCSKFHNFSMKIRGETRVQSWTFLALFFRKRIVQWEQGYSQPSTWVLPRGCYQKSKAMHTLACGPLLLISCGHSHPLWKSMWSKRRHHLSFHWSSTSLWHHNQGR